MLEFWRVEHLSRILARRLGILRGTDVIHESSVKNLTDDVVDDVGTSEQVASSSIVVGLKTSSNGKFSTE